MQSRVPSVSAFGGKTEGIIFANFYQLKVRVLRIKNLVAFRWYYL